MSRTATVSPFGPVSPTPSLGRRGDNNIRACFPASPLQREYNTTTVENVGNAALLGNGGPGDSVPNIGVSNGVVNDGGYFYGTFNLNYNGSPNLDDVATGGEGLPASPYVPNPTSPGPGSVNPYDVAPYTGPLPRAHTLYGVGLGGTVSPSNTTEGVSGNKIGQFISGRSYNGSDGRS
jgi:hypothetical protein